MTPPPTSIDGTDITGATIDGTEVTEITVDGQTVFTSGFSYFDDFDTISFSEYTLRNNDTIESSSNWDISNSELTHPDSPFGTSRTFEYDLSSENLTGNLAVQMEISNYIDDDMFACGFLESDNTTYMAAARDQFTETFGLGDSLFQNQQKFPPTTSNAFHPGESPDVVSSEAFAFSTPIIFRLEYDDSANELELFVDGDSKLTFSVTIGTITSVFWGESGNDPALSWDSVTVEEF